MGCELPSAFLNALWSAVVSVGRPLSASQYRNECAEVRHALRMHHGVLREGLNRLVTAGYLRTDSSARHHRTFWFSASCKTPPGVEVATPHIDNGAALATSRQFANSMMPKDTAPLFKQSKAGAEFDFERCPSRRGDRLYFRDGRVTDLDGRAA